jgi:hypothetical protein
MFIAAARARRGSLWIWSRIFWSLVYVDRGHQATLDADRFMQHLGHRREAVGGARGVRDDLVIGGQLVVVHAKDDGEVDTLGRAEISTRLAPASRCFYAGARWKKPVHSMSMPLAACGRLAGSFSAVT